VCARDVGDDGDDVDNHEVHGDGDDDDNDDDDDHYDHYRMLSQFDDDEYGAAATMEEEVRVRYVCVSKCMCRCSLIIPTLLLIHCE
jgi:hypothetical protein